MQEIKADKALNLIILAGEIMLSSGAETYRIEETMQKMAESFGFEIAETFVTTTGIFATIGMSEETTVTMVKRVKQRTIHLGKVSEVNSLSRKMASDKLPVETVYEELMNIKNLPSYSKRTMTISVSVACFCTCYMFGGSIRDCLNAAANGFILYQFLDYAGRHNMSKILTNIFGAGIVATSTLMLINLQLSSNIDTVIIGSIIPLVPGVALTNAIRDILGGDFLSGTSRIVDAIIVAICIATGVGSVFQFWYFLFGGLII